MLARNRQGLLVPKLLSFDVFGTLIDARSSALPVFARSLVESGAAHLDVVSFFEHWEARKIAHYREPYRSYREICALSLAETCAQFQVRADAELLERYFEAFATFRPFPDVADSLRRLARGYKLALVSNIDDDLLAATPLGLACDLVCTAERARGYKPDGTLFRYLLAHAGVGRSDILHCGQSQFTDMVGAKPLGLTVAWINRRGLRLHPSVPPPDFELADVAALFGLVAAP